MLKLTTEEGGECYINPAKLFAVIVGDRGQTTLLSSDMSYLGVKESAEDVARLMDKEEA